MTQHVQIITNSPIEFLNFLRSKVPLFHMSNVFYRDLMYGVIDYLEKRDVKVSFSEAEAIAQEIIGNFEKRNLLRKVNPQGWVLNYPEFTTPKAQQPPAPQK
ncbi:MAG TPA: hypothetical protein VK470_14890 [Bacteroidota bacterium]|nr:hypothetical protein [Bacteroidota bacterium]